MTEHLEPAFEAVRQAQHGVDSASPLPLQRKGLWLIQHSEIIGPVTIIGLKRKFRKEGAL